MKKKRSSILQKLDSNFMNKLENLFGGTKKINKTNKNKNTKNKNIKRKKTSNVIKKINYTLPPPLPPPLRLLNIKEDSVTKTEQKNIEKIEKIETKINKKKIEKTEQKNIEKIETKINKKKIEKTEQKIIPSSSINEKIINKLIILNSELIDREIIRLKHTSWLKIEKKSFLFGIMLSVIITYIL